MGRLATLARWNGRVEAWFDTRPVALFVFLTVVPILTVATYAVLAGEPLYPALRHGLVFGLGFSTVSTLLDRWRS